MGITGRERCRSILMIKPHSGVLLSHCGLPYTFSFYVRAYYHDMSLGKVESATNKLTTIFLHFSNLTLTILINVVLKRKKKLYYCSQAHIIFFV